MKTRRLWVLAIVCALMALAVAAVAAPSHQEWIGQEVVFLPKLPQLQRFGYQSYSFIDRSALSSPAAYHELAGKRATVLSAVPGAYSALVTLLFEDGRALYGRAFGGNLDDVVFVSELDHAQQYIGRAVWHKTKHGHKSLWNYNMQTGDEHRVTVRNLERFEVLAVGLGPFGDKPLCFTIRRDSSETIFWYGSYSRLNDTQNGLLDPFGESWHLSNPIALHPDWPEDAWDLIRDFEVAIGMTPEMVRMAWGEPKTITRSITQAGRSEHWHYGNRGSYDHLFANVLFQDGRVTAIYD